MSAKRQTLTSNLNGWICDICDRFNDILTSHCWNCGNPRTASQNIIDTIRLKRMGIVASEEFNTHADFFSRIQADERILIADMTLAQKELHLEALSKIVMEAKVRQVVVSDAVREAKAKNKVWSSNDEETPIDELNDVVKERRARISKSEKLKSNLMGILGDDAKEILNKLNLNKSKTSNIELAISQSQPQPNQTEPIEETKPEPMTDFDGLFD